MPIHEIRESIERDSITLDSNGYALIQKEINLKPNMSHQMLQGDLFLDNPMMPNDSSNFLYYEFMVTPTPVVYTDMNIGALKFPNRLPSASLDNVLYKSTIYQPSSAIPPVIQEEFPNRFISARPTFTWYHPKLYLTLAIHGDANKVIEDISMTFYCAVEAKKVSLVTYGMGVLREDHIAQVAAVMSNGRSIPPSRNVGQSFPMWKYGGSRAELMISGSNLASFFNRQDSMEASETNTTGRLRRMARDARQMQPNLDAFGTAGTADGDIPSWISMELFKGVESGAVREQWPPIKHADNGNVLTF